MLKTAVFETQCSGSGCTFNGCESSGSDTCDGQMIHKLNKIQSSINNIGKPRVIECKSGWKRYNGHCYYLFKKKMNWFDAQVFCRKQSTTLLQINDATENRWVSKAFPNVRYWIDYTDIGKEGNWVALSTGRNDYSNWHKAQPDNSGDQDCAKNNYSRQRGHWDDDGCYDKFPPLCETSGQYDTNQYQWGRVGGGLMMSGDMMLSCSIKINIGSMNISLNSRDSFKQKGFYLIEISFKIYNFKYLKCFNIIVT